jgi:hypothetical protein
MHFITIGDRAINLDNVAHIEHKNWHDCTTAKVHFVGQGNNTPLMLSEAEAKELSQYVEYVAERPISPT